MCHSGFTIRRAIRAQNCGFNCACFVLYYELAFTLLIIMKCLGEQCDHLRKLGWRSNVSHVQDAYPYPFPDPYRCKLSRGKTPPVLTLSVFVNLLTTTVVANASGCTQYQLCIGSRFKKIKCYKMPPTQPLTLLPDGGLRPPSGSRPGDGAHTLKSTVERTARACAAMRGMFGRTSV